MEGLDENPRLARRRLAFGLLDMREDLGLTQSYVAELVGMTQQTLASVEGERTVPAEDTLRKLLRAYGREDHTDELLERRRIARLRDPQWRGLDLTVEPAGFEDYVGLEAGASLIEAYELRIVPGILQTRAYAEHVIKGGERSTRDLERKIDIRVRRQNILTRDENPAHLRMIVEESALTHPAAPPDVMREQYDCLLELAERSNVELQICPRSAGAHVGMVTSFTTLQFASPHDPGLVAVETAITTLFFDRPAQINQFSAIMRTLQATALSQDDSAAMIENMRKE